MALRLKCRNNFFLLIHENILLWTFSAQNVIYRTTRMENRPKHTQSFIRWLIVPSASDDETWTCILLPWKTGLEKFIYIFDDVFMSTNQRHLEPTSKSQSLTNIKRHSVYYWVFVEFYYSILMQILQSSRTPSAFRVQWIQAINVMATFSDFPN